MRKRYLTLVNANVLTMDDFCPRAAGVVICGEKIESLIKIAEPLSNVLKGEVIDCCGKTIMPGFIDAHCHFIGLAESLVLPDISSRKANSIADIQQIVADEVQVTPPGNWIRARGYQLYNMFEKRHPDRYDLDAVTTLHPVCLSHIAGYIHILNSPALEKSGINAFSEAPPGASIERDLESGQPNGILFGMREYLSKYVPHTDDTAMLKGFRMAAKRYLSHGITSLQDASAQNSGRRFDMYTKYQRDTDEKPRAVIILGADAYLRGQSGCDFTADDFLKVNGVKIVLSESSGELYPCPRDFKAILRQIHADGRQAVVHAIEEHVICRAIEAIRETVADFPPRDHRHRLEHCSVCSLPTAQKLASLHVCVVSQPGFVYYNGERYLKTVPEEQKQHLYPFKTLLDAGITLAAGSDAPVIAENPLNGVYGAVSRRTDKGNLLLGEEKVTVYDALKMYTINAAYAAFEEKIKGSITPGKLADMIMLSADPTGVDIRDMKDISVELTIVGGRPVYTDGII